MADKKLHVAVIFGGRSGEHEVSLMSARSVLSVLDSAKYEVTQIGITHEGKWLTGEDVLGKFESRKLNGLEPFMFSPDPSEASSRIDVFFPVLHGTFGEDGTIQGLFELADVAYVGAGVVGSSVGMDKGVFKDVMIANRLDLGLPTVRTYIRNIQAKLDVRGNLVLCGFLVVRQEFLQPDGGERMVEQGKDGAQGACGHVGAYLRALDDVHRMTHTGSKDLRIEAVVVIDGADLLDQLHAIRADVVQAADERRYVSGTGLGRQQGLPGAEYQRAVGLDALVGEILDGLYPIAGHGQFYRDVRMQCRQIFPLAHHAVIIGGDHFSAHVAVHDIADVHIVFHHLVRAGDALLGT